MGLLDDLRNQADSKRASEEEEANRVANREQYYLDKIQPRMVKTYQFFNELVEHLNYIKLETVVDYPLQPGGAPQPLRQEGYKVVIDSSKAIKKVDFTMEGVLDEPVQFEVFGRDAVANHKERIQRYSFRHECKIRKDAQQYIQSALFILEGPLPLRVSVEADIPTSKIKVTIRNFTEPGFSSRVFTVEEFNDEFLDKIGKFVLRKEPVLFGSVEELSDEAKKKLRDRMIVEQRIRQQEMIEAEARRQAEEAAAKEKSTAEQLKRVVNTKVAKGKESLKDMFSKLKKQAGFDETSTDTTLPPPTVAAPKQQARQQQPPQQPAAAAPAQQQGQQPAQQAPRQPAVAAPRQQQGQQPAQQASRQPAAAAPRQPAGQQSAQQPPQQRVVTSPAKNQGQQSPQQPAAAAPKAKAAEPKVAAPPPKKAQPPKVFNVEGPNPFLNPDDPVPEPASNRPEAKTDSDTASDRQGSGEKIDALEQKQAAKPAVVSGSPDLALSPEELERDLANIIERDKSGDSEVKSENAPPAEKKPKPYIKPGELITDLSMELELPQKDLAKEDSASPVLDKQDQKQQDQKQQEPKEPELAKPNISADKPAAKSGLKVEEQIVPAAAKPDLKVEEPTAASEPVAAKPDLKIEEPTAVSEPVAAKPDLKIEEPAAASEPVAAKPELKLEEPVAAIEPEASKLELKIESPTEPETSKPDLKVADSTEPETPTQNPIFSVDDDDAPDIDLAVPMPQFNAQASQKSSQPTAPVSHSTNDDTPEPKLTLTLEDQDQAENPANDEEEAPLELKLEPPTDDSTPK